MAKFGPKNLSSTNWLKFATGVYCYVLISNLLFIFPKFCDHYFLGQKLKYSKSTKIWYSGTLLYAYFDFNVYFSKIFVIYAFLANLVPQFGFLQIDWYFVEGCIAICLLRLKCLFFQNYFYSYFLGKFGLKIWRSSKWLKFCTGVHSICLLRF